MSTLKAILRTPSANDDRIRRVCLGRPGQRRALSLWKQNGSSEQSQCRSITTWLFLTIFSFPLTLNAIEDNPSACECDTIELSEQEIVNGCPAHVKEQTCSLYREIQIWKQRLRDQQKQRELEKKMEPLNIPRAHR